MADRQKKMEEALQSPASNQSSANEESADSIDLMALAYRLLANWKIILITALIGAVISAVYTLRFVTPMYRATAQLYVVGRTDSLISYADLQLGSQLTSDYIQVFQTWEMQEEVIAGLNLDYTYGQMRKMLNVSNPSGTRILNIAITSPDRKEAAAIANQYAKSGCEYIEKIMNTDKPTLLSSALVPDNPVSPSKTKNIALGFILGGLASAAVIVLKAVLDDKYKSAEDIRKYTGLVTLAIVPLEDSDVDVEVSKSAKSRRNT